MARALILLVPVAVLGVIGAAVAVVAHESDTAFLFNQEHAVRLEPGQVEAALEEPGDRDPVPSGRRALVRTARCVPGSSGPRRNPWECSVAYRSGHRIRYRLVVTADGRYRGSDRTGQYLVSGAVAGASSAGR